MSITQNTSKPNRRLSLLALALFAGGAGLLTGAGCTSTSHVLTGDPLAAGGATIQLAARQQLGGGNITSDTPNVKAGVVSPEDDAKIARLTSQLLTTSHYARKAVDDSLSPKVYDAFLDTLDPQHLLLLQSDVDSFSDQYQKTIVGLTTTRGDFSPIQKMYETMLERSKEQNDYVNSLLKDNSVFTFTGNDTFPVDRKDAPHPKTQEEARQLWKERLRYEYLQEKLGKEKPEEIVKTLSRRYERTLRTLKEYDSDDLFELYMNTITHVLDPHTDYFGKASAENFGITMKLSLYGIGARLRSEDGFTVVDDITPGSPAQATKKLKSGDKIVGVAQGADGAFVDVVDMKLNRVVEQIRGPKGSTVRLKIVPADAADPSKREEVVIVRDEIKLEESAAKAYLIEAPNTLPQIPGKTMRIGVINLPLFYMDPDTGKSCSADVALLLAKLKAEKANGVILDLRGNGGGSLPESIQMAGLFIKQGPVVQVRDPSGRIKVDEDRDPSVTYDGPLAVLTSRGSASASEIVTGALQDYGRAIVIGDQSSYGKGTVQALVNLAPIMEQNNISVADDPGQLKLTTQKFYRASGSSTQLKGVTPDVILPSVYDALKVGEKDSPNALPWDTVPAARYQKLNRVAPYVAELDKRSAARIATDPDFAYLKQTIARVAKVQDEKTVTLNEVERRKEQDEEDKRIEARQKTLVARPAPPITVYVLTLKDAVKPGLPKPLTADQIKKGIGQADASMDDESPKPTPSTKGVKDKPRLPEPDITLTEASRILQDYIVLSTGKPTPVVKR